MYFGVLTVNNFNGSMYQIEIFAQINVQYPVILNETQHNAFYKDRP